MFELVSNNIEIYKKGIRVSNKFFVPVPLLIAISKALDKNTYHKFIMDKYAFTVDEKGSRGSKLIYRMYNKDNKSVFVSRLDILICSYILQNKYVKDDVTLLEKRSCKLNCYKIGNKVYIVSSKGEPIIGEYDIDDLKIAMSSREDIDLSIDSLGYQNKFTKGTISNCLQGGHLGWCHKKSDIDTLFNKFMEK